MTDPSSLAARLSAEISPEDMAELLARVETIDRLQEDVEQRWNETVQRYPSAPWEGYHDMRTIFTCNWVARVYSLIGGHLAAAPNPAPVTRAQAVVLLMQLGDCIALLQRALKWSPRSSMPPPMQLGPRVQEEEPTPLLHLTALFGALEALHGAAASEMDRFDRLVPADAPIRVRIVGRRLRAETDAARRQVEATRGSITTQSAFGQAEDRLWSELEAQLWLGQLIFDPGLLSEPQTGRDADPLVDGPWSISEDDLLCLTPPVVQSRLAEHGLESQLEEELRAFWAAKAWELSEEEQRFLVEIGDLQRSGAVDVASYLDEAPYSEVWVARESVTVGNRYIVAGTEFAYDHRAGEDRIVTDLESPAE